MTDGGNGERGRDRQGGNECVRVRERERAYCKMKEVKDLHDRAWTVACWQCCHSHTLVLEQPHTRPLWRCKHLVVFMKQFVKTGRKTKQQTNSAFILIRLLHFRQ